MGDERAIQEFSVQLNDLPKNMRIFSLCLRSLYAENAVGSSSDAATGINKMRDDTRKDAMVYVKGILPLSTQVVRSIQDFFENYEALDFDEWKECLCDIVDDVKGYEQCCTEIVRMHEYMMVPLKRRQDEAKVILSELKDLNETLKRKKRELEEGAVTKKGWAIGLLFIPLVGMIASPILGMEADSDLASAVAEGQQIDINQRAVVVVSETLIPALSAFVEGLNAVAGFFNIMKEELTGFKTKGEAAIDQAKKLHYIKMKKKAVEMKGNCREFYAMIPGVRTDLMCIPENPDDQNYVDKWLVKQQEEIRRKYSSSISSKLKKMIQHFTTEGANQLMIKEK